MFSKKSSFVMGLSSLLFCFSGSFSVNAEELYRNYTSPSGRYSDYSDSSGGRYTLDSGNSGGLLPSRYYLEGEDGDGNRVSKECIKGYGSGRYMECY